MPSKLATRAKTRLRVPAGWGFVAPYLVVLIAFGIAPAVYGLYQAFSVTSPVSDPYFSLTQNFLDVLRDYRLPGASWNVAKYLLIWLPLLLVVVFVLALAMDAKRTKFAALTRFVTYVPGAVTGSSAALLWLFMSSPAVSPIGPFLKLFADKSGSFLSDQTFALLLSVMGTAAGAGGWIVVVYGALVGIPQEVIESAVLDGASAWDTVWHIKLPLIRSYIAFILIISLAQGFQLFVEPTVISAGAPGQVSRTWSINQLVYSYATDQSNYGRASALAILLLLVCVALAVLIITKTKFYSIGDR
ncbi:MAG TPA: sugar ABC transporter permease [Devosiaceae bacterium]|jgi:multiple sugar transport system permease protein|nr:sugar ABC transporter permease [Devosiaceae bacterium]